MKVLIASDIHGSYYYAKKVKEAFEREKADLLVLLGDIYYHGPRNPFPEEYAPMKVADLLNSMKEKLLVIKGNCDSEVDQMISQFDFVEFSQILVDGIKVSLTHGHKFNKENMPLNAGDLLCYGHFHTGFITNVGDVVVANAGSVSLPKDNTKSSYLTLDKGLLCLKDIEGNLIDSKQIK